MRASSFQNTMARLALIAMLLLALLPTLGRLASHGAQAVDAGWAAMCTATGLRYVDLSASADDATQAVISDHALPHTLHQHDGPDCAYCPLLASLTVLALVLALLLPLQLQTQGCTPRQAVRRKAFHPCGLGSRGPPLAL